MMSIGSIGPPVMVPPTSSGESPPFRVANWSRVARLFTVRMIKSPALMRRGDHRRARHDAVSRVKVNKRLTEEH
jgi:hypothetical protein